MAFRIKLDEPLPQEIKRVITHEIKTAVAALTKADHSSRDRAIHEARKSVKKIRATLHLVRSSMGPAFKLENERFRDIGRQLSDLRDGSAIIETFDGLVHRHDSKLKPDALRQIRTGLERSKAQHEKAVHVQELLRHLASSLETASEHVKDWPLKSKNFELLAAGFEQTYRRGRKTMSILAEDPSSDTHHEWRKRVKRHWYHVRLLEDLWVQVMKAHQDSLDEIASALGDDHNLSVLCDKLESAPDEYGGRETVELFTALARADQQALRENARSVGQQVFDEKPVRFRKYMHRLWDVSQTGKPAPPEKLQKSLS